MARRIDEASRVILFFETAPTDVALAIFGVVKSILARRQPKAKPAKPPRKGAPLLDGAEIAVTRTGSRS